MGQQELHHERDAIFGLLVIFIAAWAPPRIYVIKGRRHFAAGQYQQSVADYQHAIRFSPTFARAYVELGDANRQLARYDEAEKAFKQAMSLEDESCASCGLGVTYSKTGRYVEAEKAFKRAMQLNPNDVVRTIGRAGCTTIWAGIRRLLNQANAQRGEGALHTLLLVIRMRHSNNPRWPAALMKEQLTSFP